MAIDLLLKGGQVVTEEDGVQEGEKYLAVGMDPVIFNLRFRFAEWSRSIELLGKEVLPRVPKRVVATSVK